MRLSNGKFNLRNFDLLRYKGIGSDDFALISDEFETRSSTMRQNVRSRITLFFSEAMFCVLELNNPKLKWIIDWQKISTNRGRQKRKKKT